ncbi:sensor histidine kinase [Pelagicoccus sp. NFK12]|uniref:Sensor histidine kinase n=1 Tax=Pelagicoccus enzymogenes TaxID=2773457 RepID=A0A927FBS8_9BACT|nr:sensor histidine kinase [Pelagicoccus enzymogenes]MBD5782207.1 sensor histidine kinase [Pelagicoccus enzymogenes]
MATQRHRSLPDRPIRPRSKAGFRVLASSLALATIAPVVGQTPPQTAPLQSAFEVRALSVEQASQALPVEIEGVVLGRVEPYHQAFVLVDDRGDSLYAVDLQPPIAPVKAGQRVRVRGSTDPGGYAPFLSIESVDQLGEGELPAPLPVTLSDLSAGGLDSRWVETYGIVRSCRVADHDSLPDGKSSLIELAYGKERISVQAQFATDPESLIDAQIRFRAICVNQHNRNRQFIQPALLIPAEGEITIESRPETPPFQSEPAAISSLLEFYPNIDYHHRVHIQGALLHAIPGESLWIRDRTRAIRVATEQLPAPPPHSQLSIAGFLASDAYSPALEDAEFRIQGASTAAEPRILERYADAFEHDADLVRFRGILTDKRPQPDGVALRFEWQDSQNNVTAATLISGEISPSSLPAVGSLLNVTGICSVVPYQTDNISGSLTPQSFELLIRSASDLQVLQAPPFWDRETVVWLLLALLSLATLAALAIYLAAQRRLKEQARQREMAEAEFTAILRERNRLAREIHDTLSQGLGATSVQLELAKNRCPEGDEALLKHLDNAHQIVRTSLGEARTSIWNMRSQILEKFDLPEALTAILHQLTEQAGVAAKVKVDGPRRRLSTAVENNLLRIGQEAITNATKYASAKQVRLDIAFTSNEINIAIADDGIGFDPASSHAKSNSFGLVGMKERADHIGASLRIDSAPGTGTRISVRFAG